MFYILILSFFSLPIFSFQDDVPVIINDDSALFLRDDRLTFFGAAKSEARLGSYVWGDSHHHWRGGLEADVSLISFSRNLAFHMSLSLETLADDQNDINFRLLYNYYRSGAGLKWYVGPGVLSIDYRHRCGHGMDNVVNNRILIRSGPYLGYHYIVSFNNVNYDIIPFFNIYLVGQNNDINQQPKGSFGLVARIAKSFFDDVSLFFTLGSEHVVLSSSRKSLYFISDELQNIHIDSLFSWRFGMQWKKKPVISEIGLHYSQISDTGLNLKKTSSSNLSLDVNFFW